MATKEEEPAAAAVQFVSPVGVVEDIVVQDAGLVAATPATPAPPPVLDVAATPSSVASPPVSTLSPVQTIPTTPQGVYPKPLASHDAVIADEQLFMETFYRFHTVLKSRPTIPKMGGKDLDVHLLYREVSSRGGLQAVIRDRKWKEITLVFELPRTTTSASYVLRKYYITLLFHYEQVYKNGATGPLLTPPAALSGSSPSVQPGDSAHSEGAEPIVRKRVRKRRITQPQLPTIDPTEPVGSTVIGAIEGKLDFGYLVTMVVGGEKLKGVLYHVPPGNKGPQFTSLPGLLSSMNADLLNAGGETQTRRKRRRKDEMPKKDPNAPRPNRTGYNFFFAEQRQRLKALHPDKDREISRMIGEAWNALSEAEKLPYQERGVKDKERFKREFRDYREKLRTGFYDNPANANGQQATKEVRAGPEQVSATDPGLSGSTTVPPIANSGHTGVSEQLSSEQNPTPSLVPTQ